MEKIAVEFANCYGIKSLKHEFDTSTGRAFLIYAPNGSMKSSFAKVFKDVSKGKYPSDIVFPTRKTTYSITDEQGNNISGNRLFVVEPYEDSFNSTRTATLLVNQELRLQYENAVQSINETVDKVLSNLSSSSHITKTNVVKELSSAFGFQEKDSLILLEEIAQKLTQENDDDLAKIPYREIFNDEVIRFLSTESMRQMLQEYIERYDELISKSTYFRKGLFDHNNAEEVGQALNKYGFFAAKHSILLSSPEQRKIEITTQSELNDVILNEKQQILNDPILTKRFEKIDEAITRNAALRQFRTLLENNPFLLPELADIPELRRKHWLSYSNLATTEFAVFMSTYTSAKYEISEVIEKAKKDETEWQKVVSIFHERFSVPFSLEISNQDDVILKNAIPSLIFRYTDGGEVREIGRDELMNVLSTGEKRALYLLNVIFDIEACAKEPEDTILIMDDVADSFDYRNKYAIVEYINSILEKGKFIIFILTHNFDFFRTVQSRLNIGRKNNCLMSVKANGSILLKPANYLNPFTSWRQNLNKNKNICPQLGCDQKGCVADICNQKILITAIPMVRNLIEYMHGVDSKEYELLTSLLHIKENTNKITLCDLINVANKILGTSIPEEGSEIVLDLIFSQADLCFIDSESINLENKIVLSIAIRLLAEIIMIKKINNPEITCHLSKKQTRALYNLFKDKFPDDKDLLTLLNRVLLMTPETIHLNSFMYEPILDLSDIHLRDLYNDLRVVRMNNP